MCDTVCVVDEHRMMFAKNSDRPPSEPQVMRAFQRRAAESTGRTQYLEIPDHDANAFVGSQPTWLWGVEHGMNEHGVAIGNEKVWTTGRPRTRPEALLGMDIVRLGLERAPTADAALAVMTELIERYGQGGSGELDHDEPYDSSFLIADRNGGWVLETCDRTWVAAPIASGASISNRLSVTTNWTRASADVGPDADFQHWRNPKVPTTIADHRLATTQQAVTASISDPRAIARVLRDHGASADEDRTPEVAPLPEAPGDDNRGVTVCMHVRGVQATTASMITTLSRDRSEAPRIWAALGSPCVSVYVPIFPACGVVAALSDPSTWSRFARLRDRVERDGAALPAIRSRLAEVEARLWAEADAIAPGDRGAQRAFTRMAFDPVEHALLDLEIAL